MHVILILFLTLVHDLLQQQMHINYSLLCKCVPFNTQFTYQEGGGQNVDDENWLIIKMNNYATAKEEKPNVTSIIKLRIVNVSFYDTKLTMYSKIYTCVHKKTDMSGTGNTVNLLSMFQSFCEAGLHPKFSFL